MFRRILLQTNDIVVSQKISKYSTKCREHRTPSQIRDLLHRCARLVDKIVYDPLTKK